MLNIKKHITGLKKSMQELYTGEHKQINFNKDTIVRFIPTSNPNVFAVNLSFYVSTKEKYFNED